MFLKIVFNSKINLTVPKKHEFFYTENCATKFALLFFYVLYSSDGKSNPTFLIRSLLCKSFCLIF